MTRARKLLRFAAAVCLIGAGWSGATVVTGSPAGAVEGIVAGSWWQAQPDGAPLPPPPQVKDKGPWVSSTPAGATALAAVRFTLADAEATPYLTLKIASAQPAALLTLTACPATAAWEPVTAGAWSKKPTWDCEKGEVIGEPGVEGTSYGFDLSSLATGKTVDVVLIPSPAATLAQGLPVPPLPVPAPPEGAPQPTPVFDVAFDPPDPSNVNVQTSLDESTASFDPNFNADFSAGFEVPQPADNVLPATPPPAAPAKAAAPRRVLPTVPLAPAAVRHLDRGDRIIAAIVLAALALWWYWLSTRGGAGVAARPRLSLAGPLPAAISEPPLRRRFARGPGRAPALR